MNQTANSDERYKDRLAPRHNGNQLSPRSAAEIIGLGYPGQFNNQRKRLERVLDRETGIDHPMPEFDARLWGGEEKAKRAQKDFLSTATLCVPEWGGIKLPGGEWRYGRRECEEYRDDPVGRIQRVAAERAARHELARPVAEWEKVQSKPKGRP